MALFARLAARSRQTRRYRTRRLVHRRRRRRPAARRSPSRSGSGGGPASPTARATTSSRSRSSSAHRSPPPTSQRAGVAQFGDLDGLTMFADNLVPHVLGSTGSSSFDPRAGGADRARRADRARLARGGRDPRLRRARRSSCSWPSGPGSCAAEIDQLLWLRGAGPALQGVAEAPQPLHRLLTPTRTRSRAPRPASARSSRRPPRRPAARDESCRSRTGRSPESARRLVSS